MRWEEGVYTVVFLFVLFIVGYGGHGVLSKWGGLVLKLGFRACGG